MTSKLECLHPLIRVAVFSLTLALLLVLLLRGTYCALGVAVGVFIGLPIVLLAIVVFVVTQWTTRAAVTTRVLSTILVIYTSFVIFLPLANSLGTNDVQTAKRFVEAMVPRLDDYKAQHGTYPPTLDSVLAPEEKIPRLLRRISPSYWSGKDNFWFEFFIPQGAMATWRYDSSTRSWRIG